MRRARFLFNHRCMLVPIRVTRQYSNTNYYSGRETVGELIMTNRVSQALPIIDDLIRAEGNNVALYIDKGTALLALGQHMDALDCFNAALTMQPDAKNEAQLNLNKGSTLLQLERFNEAMACYNRAIELKPDDAAYYENRAMAYMCYGHDELAMNDLNASISLHPSVRSYVNKGNVLRRQGQMEEAVHCYDQALGMNERDVSALDGKANALIAMGRYQESLKGVESALALDPDNPSLIFKRGLLLCQLDRIEEGQKCFTRAIELNPSFKQELERVMGAV